MIKHIGATAVCLLFLLLPVRGEDRTYTVSTLYETDDAGVILSQQPFSGTVVLHDTGTYNVSLHIQDEGTFKFVAAGPQQPNDMIYFYSRSRFQFFAYPQGNMLAVWLHKNPQGRNVWVQGELVAPPPSKTEPGPTETPPTDTTTETPPESTSPPKSTEPPALIPSTKNLPPGTIKDGVISVGVIYGDSSALSYYREDLFTGEWSADEKGIIFRPDGTYFLRVEMGSHIMREEGRYIIQGNIVRIVFSDGSMMDLKIVNGGQSLNWYGAGGELISEYFFLGFLK
ncbi:MAG: hypothetical protein MUP70_01825 [Candidatus Aminicenantes bacterium]|nr:hypothetical protein [Candidatus Aminicenantes bacterium]